MDAILSSRLLESVRGYAILGLSTDGHVISWNAGARELFGYESDEIVGRHFAVLFSAEDVAADVPADELARALAGAPPDERRRLLVRKDGSRFLGTDVVQPIYDEARRLLGFSKLVQDVTKQTQLLDDLQRKALRDPLTDLPNRRSFDEHIARAIAFSGRHPDKLFAVLFIDIDHFKTVNDDFGHTFGDLLLVQIARLLETCVRPEDVVCRLGGDEFAILLTGISGTRHAKDVANRIVVAMTKLFDSEGQKLPVSASIGIAVSSSEYVSPGHILRDADRAMYAAKLGGRSQAALFDETMAAQEQHIGSDLLIDLRDAIGRHELVVAYQSIVSVYTGDAIGFEALVRWQHPTRGLLWPADFIALAESTNLIILLDRWVMREACRCLQTVHAQHRRNAHIYISVNMSANHFSRTDTTSFVHQTLTEFGLEPRHLRIEITEISVLQHSPAVARSIRELRNLGVQVYVDDFGTGYSSLLFIRERLVDALKIDREFVSGSSIDDGILIAKMIADLAESFEIVSIAEGVETREQLERVKAIGCQFAQGYYFSRPLAAELIGDYLRVNSACELAHHSRPRALPLR